MRRSEFMRGAVACLLAGGASSALAADPAALPRLEAETLEGQRLILPDRLPGARTLVIVTTKQEHTAGRVAWANRMGGHRAVPLLDLALFDDYGAMFRGLVRDKMKEGISDPASRSGIALVFGGKQGHLRSLGITSEEKVAALVIEREGGLVLAREIGDPTAPAVARLSALLKAG